MQIPDSQWMSCRAYAKRRGISAMSVSIAIKKGRLKASVIRDENGNPKISDPELADREWEANTDYTDHPEYAPGGSQSKLPAASKEKSKQAIDEPTEGAETDSIYESSNKQKFWQAKLAELKFKEAAAILVPAADVEAELTTVFIQCKSKLLSIPTRAKQSLPHLTVSDLAELETLIREALEDLAQQAEG